MKTLKAILFSAIFIYIGIVITGCETEPSEQIALQISPNTASIAVGSSQEFVASGFADYTWSLSDEESGVLSTLKGERTVYTAATSLSNDVQILTVTANATSSSTNSTSAVSAEAIITHL